MEQPFEAAFVLLVLPLYPLFLQNLLDPDIRLPLSNVETDATWVCHDCLLWLLVFVLKRILWLWLGMVVKNGNHLFVEGWWNIAHNRRREGRLVGMVASWLAQKVAICMLALMEIQDLMVESDLGRVAFLSFIRLCVLYLLVRLWLWNWMFTLSYWQRLAYFLEWQWVNSYSLPQEFSLVEQLWLDWILAKMTVQNFNLWW